MAELSLSQAAKLAGKSKSTLSRSIKNGRLSARPGENGQFLIDVAELERIFGPLQQGNASRNALEERHGAAMELAVLKARLGELEEDRRDLRHQLEQEREERKRLVGIIEDQTKSLVLIEDHREKDKPPRPSGDAYGATSATDLACSAALPHNLPMSTKAITVKETTVFTRRVGKLLSFEERESLIDFLALNPEAGDEIEGTGGVRKVRYSAKGRGKSGGVRVIYYYYTDDIPLYALLIYGKNERANLTSEEKKAVTALVAAAKRDAKQRRSTHE